MKKRDNREALRSILELGVDPITIILTTTMTILFSILSGLVNDDGLLYVICDRGFYISLSVIMLQCLIQNYFISEKSDSVSDAVDSITKHIKANQCVVFPERKNFINNIIEDILNSGKVRKMKIICYGTSKFGRIIDSVITAHAYVQVDVIVCSPDVSFFDPKTDRQLLVNVINELAQYENITVYASHTPPTLRACVMYIENDRPIFCSMQPYYLFVDDNYKIFKGEGFSPTIMADCDNEIFLMQLVGCFDREFSRLVKCSSKPELLTDDSLVKY